MDYSGSDASPAIVDPYSTPLPEPDKPISVTITRIDLSFGNWLSIVWKLAAAQAVVVLLLVPIYFVWSLVFGGDR